MKLLAVIIFTAFISTAGYGQDYPRKNIDQSRLADELFGFQDLDLSYEELYENTLQLFSNPININKAGPEELRFLNILSETQIQHLLQHRKEHGALVSIYELQTITDFDLATIYRFVPFVYVADPAVEINKSILKRAYDENNNFVITRYERTLETKTGFTDDTPDKQFKGSEDKFYLRFRTSRPGDFSFGLTAEKDAGEQLQWRPSSKQYLFDFISYHAQVQNKGRLKNLIIGDYQSQFAQGLMFGGAFGMGKGAETITAIRRCNIGFSPYTSANEFGLQRGIATTYEITPKLFLSGFLSSINRDANIVEGEGFDSGVSSFQTTGLHRNETELANRKSVKENNNGIILHYNTRNLDAGIMYNYLRYGKHVDPKNAVYHQFTFSGNENHNAGVYLNYNYNNFLFFSEIAKSIDGGWGGIAGIIGSLTSKLDFSLIYRKYNRNFHSTYSNAFAESTLPQNESGIYWGWRYRFNRQVSWVGYIDMFRFPWLRFRSYRPSNGSEWLARLNYQPSKQVLIFVQAREERKVRNVSSDPVLYRTAEGIKRNYWINFSYDLSNRLKMKTRVQASSYHFDSKTTNGFALIQDLSYDIGRFGITARHALFDTDDFDNRQYAYEQDVWLAYSLPSYYGTGIRNFILLEYNLGKKITLWLRYARTRYSNVDSIGSGQDQIDGNSKNDIKFQMRLKL
jgi:hypothetical protein